ncbi:hypothetical protein [Sphingomonas daechungensis]|uniref:hypothetical protein n=1 Tax=Sphingomonas daechungensis TaxID=1176646 RepID=UPI0037836681
MATASNRAGTGWGTRFLIGLALVIAGAAGAAWGLARFDGAARFLGVAPKPVVVAAPKAAAIPQAPAQDEIAPEAKEEINQLENRLERVETAAERVEGSAGRADALLIAFAARRAVDRGVALGYLEPLLLDRFGQTHARAVATIVTGSHSPVRLSDLTEQYRALGPELRAAAPDESFWAQFRRELGSIIEIRHADRPSTQADARYAKALAHLQDGEVDQALAETMRLPGAANAQDWIRQARQYVAVHRALDEIESGALLAKSQPTTL